ncbi:MAG TPA: carboxypeptidase regulatory-like domain-containing protein [Thermoanaerobaculia bacterium]|nr:carboxypeptidase regulatory-like domain-containing protein [Thermoanaerobaculia bacterium]
MKKFLSLMFAMLTVFVIACGGGKEAADVEDEGEDDGEEIVATASTSSETTVAAAAPAAVSADAATIVGTAKLEGAPSKMGAISMGADPACQSQHSSPTMTQDVVAGAAGELANVLVYVKNAPGSFPVPTTPALLDQKGCQYTPHVSAIQVGQTLEIKNSDPTLHNVHALAKVNKEFNEGQPVQGMVSKKVFDKPEEIIKFKCDVHGWMNSYMAVLPHPFHGVSNQGGSFTIGNLPPGTYTLVGWHEKFGKQEQQVTVGAKESKPVTFTFKAS